MITAALFLGAALLYAVGIVTGLGLARMAASADQDEAR